MSSGESNSVLPAHFVFTSEGINSNIIVMTKQPAITTRLRSFLKLGNTQSWIVTILRLILAGVFLTAGLGKLFQGNPYLTLADYRFLPGPLATPVGMILPWTEVLLGILLVLGYFNRLVVKVAVCFIIVFIGMNTYSLISGNPADCHCFGGILHLNHWQALIIDLIMLMITGVLWRNRLAVVTKKLRERGLKRVAPAVSYILIITILLAGFPAIARATDAAAASTVQHPLMHPTAAQLAEWEKEYQNAPTVPSSSALMDSATATPTSFSLLSDIKYTPANSNQGQAGNCWVWAGTGIMEAALDVNESIFDRLSIQYLDSNYNNGDSGDWAGCGGSLTAFEGFYNSNSNHRVIPWSNTNASYQDALVVDCPGNATVPENPIGLTPYYAITSNISVQNIPTTGSSQR